MPVIRLVIFDCDGVLVDSERATSEAIAGSLRPFGYPISGDEVLARYLGRTLSQIESDIRTKAVRLPPDWQQQCEGEMYEALRKGVPLSPGTLELLGELCDGGVRVAVCSNGAAAKMRITLGPHGLWDRLEPMTLSGQDTGNPKPSPVMLRILMDRAQVTPAETVMVDDSRAGLDAADAAGCHFIGYLGCREHSDFDSCGDTVRSMHDIQAIISRLGSSTLPETS